jgi:hypothetical protein
MHATLIFKTLESKIYYELDVKLEWGETRNAYKNLAVKTPGKRSLRRQRRKHEDNIKKDLKEIGYEGEM